MKDKSDSQVLVTSISSRNPTLHPGVSLESEFLRLLPSEVRVLATEVTVDSSLLEDRPTQLQVTHQAARAEVEVIVDDIHHLLVGLARAGLASACTRDTSECYE